MSNVALEPNVRKAAERKVKKELHSSWYFGAQKTAASTRVVPFGETLYQALKQKDCTIKMKIKYGEYYLILSVAKREIDEKGDDD